MFENDYLMRQIELLSNALGKMLFQKDITIDEGAIIDDQGTISQGYLLLYQLKGMVREKRVNEAEDLLFDTIEKEPREEFLQSAVDFYADLQQMSDEELADCDFSREEIREGFSDILAIYKIETSDKA